MLFYLIKFDFILFILFQFILFYFILQSACLTKNILRDSLHTKFQVKEPPSGYCSHLLGHPSPKVQKPSPIPQVQSPPFISCPLTKL